MKRLSPKRKIPKASRDATSASLTIDAHYARLNIQSIWTEERVERLCSFLRINYAELAAMLCMTYGGFMKQMKCSKNFSGPVCILLTVVEHRFMGDYAPDTISNIFNFTGYDKSKNT